MDREAFLLSESIAFSSRNTHCLIWPASAPSFRQAISECSMLDQPRPFPGSLKARASVVLRRGMPTLPLGIERYRVPGNGSVMVPVEADDEITLKDIEGQQACEILHADASGRIDIQALGGRAGTSAEGLKSVLSR